LSLAQTGEVIQKINYLKKGIDIQVVPIKTRGDIYKNRPLFEFKKSGIFTSNLNLKLLEKEVDCVVHSLKDLPLHLNSLLLLASVPKRGPSNDVFISKNGTPLNLLKPDARIGTGSIRRAALLRYYRPDIEVVPIRGNIDTRLGKLKTENLDGLVLAEAGLRRLNHDHYITEKLSETYFPPAPGQGALAIIVNKTNVNHKLLSILQQIEDPFSRKAIELERQVLRALGGGCHIPIGIFVQMFPDNLFINCGVISPDGHQFLYVEKQFPITMSFTEITAQIVKSLENKGVHKILEAF